ncbi:hypothetical protein [Acuticoccus yangtzensis]|uniref:hypothetical protein n=1 Tax=Acuticoccus yangtzensis TaxID=1443441 RepID=UPI00111507F8|nr:hypothetical protein [Acuticoccus yangtzensis]
MTLVGTRNGIHWLTSLTRPISAMHCAGSRSKHSPRPRLPAAASLLRDDGEFIKETSWRNYEMDAFLMCIIYSFYAYNRAVAIMGAANRSHASAAAGHQLM